ncbi:MAG TPA: efflux RND transporter periplasmic adaptor subunit [Acidobacteriota bacterium]|nr:efflux RND transporter periplasmic adaptor subunit [Acidobacteriota bacterium]
MTTRGMELIGIVGLAAAIGAAACSSRGERPAGPAFPGSPVEVAAAVEKEVPLVITSIGRVEPLSTVAVKAQVGGEVTRVYFKEGQPVRKGDRLFTIDPRPFESALAQAEAMLEKDRALLKNAESDAARYAGLVEKDYVTKEQYDALVANRDVLTAAVKADQAAAASRRLDLEYADVRAPIDGRTGKLFIDAGNIVRTIDAAPAVVIEQMTPIDVAFSVPEGSLARIRRFMAASPLRTEVVPSGEGQPAVAGVLTFIDNAIDASTGTITLRATFDNPTGALWPGQFVNVRLTLTTETGVVVPSRAVETGQNGVYVYVVKDDLTAEMRPVKVSRTYGEDALVAAGLKAGERVVTDGQLRLAPGAKVEIKPGR